MKDTLLNTIISDLQSEDIQRHNNAIDAIYWIADIVVFGGNIESLNEEICPYYELLICTKIDEELAKSIKKALRTYINTNDNALLVDAISVLSKFFDKNDIPLFNQHLEKALVNILDANRYLHQAIIALNNIEEIIPEDGALSILDTEKNIELARSYLKKQGKVFPC